VIPTIDEEFGIQKAGVHDMGPGQGAPLLPCGADLGGRRSICRRANGGFDMGDEVRQIILTGFRDIHFVAHPWRGVLAGIVGFGVIG
jgi:hypothetical protein